MRQAGCFQIYSGDSRGMDKVVKLDYDEFAFKSILEIQARRSMLGRAVLAFKSILEIRA